MPAPHPDALSGVACLLPNIGTRLGAAARESTQSSYYRARYYDQTNGRFLSEDPMRFGAGINFFRYVKNNAASLADPYGLMVQKCCRNTQVNWWVDFLSKLTGLKHCFIKTGSVIA